MAEFADGLVATLAHMLRHHPEQYLLEVDAHGWADLESVVIALRCREREWSRLSRQELEQWIAMMPVRRFETQRGRVRALYGHSLRNVVVGVIRRPPNILWHGTTAELSPVIQTNGLLPIRRRFVHLTSDRRYAEDVARSKVGLQFRDETNLEVELNSKFASEESGSDDGVILTVFAEEAFRAGIKFRQANEQVWLAQSIPSRFVECRSCGRTNPS